MTGREPVRDVDIRDTSIRLGQLLKFAGLVEHGAAAKDALEAGEVTVNGRGEDRRGRQLVTGDVVALGDERIRVRAPEATVGKYKQRDSGSPSRRTGWNDADPEPRWEQPHGERSR